MDLNEYQEKARKTAIYPKDNPLIALTYVSTGLGAESGEYLNKFKKIIRDYNGDINNVPFDMIQSMMHELGDILWYVSQCAEELGYSLEIIAKRNIEKLYKRMEENKLHGSGDNR